MAITYEYRYGNGGFILSTHQQKELEKLLIEQTALASSGAKSLYCSLYLVRHNTARIGFFC